MSYRTYRNAQYGLGAHGALIPHFPGSLTRKLYRKKIPEMTLNVPHVPPKCRTRGSRKCVRINEEQGSRGKINEEDTL